MSADSDYLTTPAAEHVTSIVREFVDAEHRSWTVQEVVSSQYDRRGARDLIFSSPEVVRRVRNYPANWHTLSDDALYALSLGQ